MRTGATTVSKASHAAVSITDTHAASESSSEKRMRLSENHSRPTQACACRSSRLVDAPGQPLRWIECRSARPKNSRYVSTTASGELFRTRLPNPRMSPRAIKRFSAMINNLTPHHDHQITHSRHEIISCEQVRKLLHPHTSAK